MPYKFQTEKKLIPKDKDKRIKLTDEQKSEIFDKYKTGSFSQRGLAREYGVSRRLIQFIVDPDKQKANYQTRMARGGSKQYYKKETNTAYMRHHRQHKKDLDDKGQLLDQEK